MRFFHKYKNHTTFENKQIPSRKPDVSLCSIEGTKRNGMHYNYLPYDAEIEYLEGTGTQYINTGKTFKSNIRVVFSVIYTQTVTQYNQTWGLNRSGYEVLWGGGIFLFGGKKITYSNPVKDTEYEYDYDFTAGKMVAKINNTIVQSTSGTQPNASEAMYIFAMNYKGNRNYYKAKHGKFKLYENGLISLDLIPVRIGTTGYMYDKVSGKLFGNAGTGDFILGQDIIPIEYIRSTGTEYIDTGIYGTMDLDFYIEFEPTELSTTYQRGVGSIFGSRTGWNQQAYQLTTYNKVSSYSTSTRGHFLCANNYGWNDNRTPTANMLLNKKNIIKKENLLFTRADGTTFTLTSQTFTTTAPIRIFQCAGAGEPSKIKLYNLKFSRNGNILRNFIPVRVGTVGYLFDKVNRQLYGNAGSGAFTLGPDIT